MCVLRVTIEIGTTIVKPKISLTGSLAFQMTEKALTWYTYPGGKLILASVADSDTIRLNLAIFVCSRLLFFLFFSLLTYLQKPRHLVQNMKVKYGNGIFLMIILLS